MSPTQSIHSICHQCTLFLQALVWCTWAAIFLMLVMMVLTYNLFPDYSGGWVGCWVAGRAGGRVRAARVASVGFADAASCLPDPPPSLIRPPSHTRAHRPAQLGGALHVPVVGVLLLLRGAAAAEPG